MSAEVHKAKHRYEGLLVGHGIDIGCGGEPITPTCDTFDKTGCKYNGDASRLDGVTDTYDWIFSSHLLEHLPNPTAAVARWWKHLKVGGFLILLVPDEDLYEQGVWPSTFNGDHKVTFTTSKAESWSPVSLNLLDLLPGLPYHKLISLTIQDTGYDYALERRDQSAGGAEVAVEMIVHKLPPQPQPIPPDLSITGHITYL
jgi:SAM-dependent methyltransferase